MTTTYPMQTILASSGSTELTWPVTLTEATGKDIHTDTVTVAFSTSQTNPGTFAAPDVKTNPTPSSVTVQKLVASSTSAGIYWLWVKIVDGTETVVRPVLQVSVA